MWQYLLWWWPCLAGVSAVACDHRFGALQYASDCAQTVTGLENVAEEVVTAARGIGMSPRQILTKVRIPLALPVIIAGIRTAAVWTVGLATLSTLVGASSFGNYIFTGLQTRNLLAVTVGSLAAACMAVILTVSLEAFSGLRPIETQALSRLDTGVKFCYHRTHFGARRVGIQFVA